MQELEAGDRRSVSMNEPNTPKQNEGVQTKRPYTSPELVRYGTIDEITAVKSPAATDGAVVSGQ
jgi:hypothetical protein